MFLDKYIALLISRGIHSPKELATILSISERDMRIKLSEMEEKGLIECNTKGFWIFKKVVCRLKDKGLELAEEVKKELEERRKKLEERLVSSDDRIRNQVIQQLIDQEPELVHIIPLMLWLNVIPATLIPALLLNELLLNRHVLEDTDIDNGYLI